MHEGFLSLVAFMVGIIPVIKCWSVLTVQVGGVFVFSWVGLSEGSVTIQINSVMQINKILASMTEMLNTADVGWSQNKDV